MEEIVDADNTLAIWFIEELEDGRMIVHSPQDPSAHHPLLKRIAGKVDNMSFGPQRAPSSVKNC